MIKAILTKIKWNKFLYFSVLLLTIQILLYSKIKFDRYFFEQTPSGDEGKYLEDLLFAIKNNYYQAIVKGASITFLILSGFINKIFENPLLSLKISSFLSAIIFFITTVYIERRFFKLSMNFRLVAYISIFYIIVLQSYLFIGVNDLLLDVFASVVFMLIFFETESSNRSKINFFLIGVFIGFMLSTRKMSLVYLPSFMLLLFFISNHKILVLTKKSVYLFLGLISVLTILNFPSIVDNKKLSFDDKVLKHDVNWAQWDYYNILKVQSGEIDRRKHVDINEVKEYLSKNGNNSLPNTFFGMIIFDYKVTLIEFYYGLKDSFFGYLRSLGLLFLFGISFLLLKLSSISKINLKNYSNLILLFAISFTILISFIVVSYVQFRWFMIFLPLLILSLLKKFQELNLNDNSKNIFLISHIIVLFIMNLPFLLKFYINN